MALTVATNTGALMAQAAASSVNKDMELSMERLSTGKRINGASDDAAGVAIASRLTGEIRGTNQAIRNAMDAQSVIDTAEGAHQEIEVILQRMRELSVQAANDSNDANDRTALQAEMDALTSEIDRIAGTTTWAGKGLMNGTNTADTPATNTTNAVSYTFQVGSNTATADTVTTSIKAMTAQALGVNGSQATSIFNFSHVDSGSSAVASGFATTSASSTGIINIASATSASSGDVLKFNISAVNITVTIATGSTGNEYADSDIGISNQIADAINAAGISATATAAADGSTVTVTTGTSVDVSSQSNAASAIDAIDAAIVTLNTQRGSLGALSNRLDSTVSNLTNISNNLQSGLGRIEDADFAAETTTLAKTQILQQASTAMLAQANASKQNVLSLLQG